MSDNILNITNGDAAISNMRNAGIIGEFLPWRDILHDGPVPTGITWSELNKIRAKYIADQGWEEYTSTLDWFNYRDSLLDLLNTYDEVILWFEHDLYDQLQLIQIFAYLADKNIVLSNISLICIADYLGPMSTDKLASLIKEKQPVSQAQLQLGVRAWRAFTNFDPIQIYSLLAKDLSILPYLKPALSRLLEQYPSQRNGLNRTEKLILDAIKAGQKTPFEIFTFFQEAETAVYMGDSTFWYYMASLSSGVMPLLRQENGDKFVLPDACEGKDAFKQQQLLITETGKAVLANQADWLDYYNIDRWYGGVHIYEDNIWRWSDETRSLCR